MGDVLCEFVRGINRGMIFWADVPRHHTLGSEQFKRRPWLVISADSIHQRLPQVVAVPISSRVVRADEFLLSRIALEIADIVPNPDGSALTFGGVVLTEQIRALAHERLEGQPAGKLSSSALAKVDAGLRYALRLS